MPPHRELNPRFHAHIARARRVRVVSVGLLVTCLLVGTGSALAMLAPQGNGAQAAIKNSLASVADTFDSVGSAFSHATASISNNLFTSRNQVAAVSSDDSISNRIYRFFCPWFTDCEEPAIEFATTNTTPTPIQPRRQPQQPIVAATTTPQNIPTQRPANVSTGPTTVVNNPVIERVVERVVQGAPASLAGYVTQADLLSQIAAVKSSVGTQLYGDWYNNPGSSSNNGGIVGTIGMMGRIENLSGTNLSDITVDGVSGLTDADIPDGITATNYLALTGGAITGDLSLSGTLTAGALAVSGVSSGGAIEAPYFTATSTSASSTFPNLNATNSTTTNATSTNMFATLGRFTNAIADAFSAVSATITNLTSTTLVATNATTTRLDAFDYVAVGRTATTTIRGDGVASTIPFASSTAVSVSGTGFFGTASTTNFNLSGTANLQSLAADSLLYNNSSRQLAAASVGSSLSFTGSSLSLNLGNGNTWTALQQFNGAASSTLFSANWAKFGATASSTFGTDGTLTMGGNIILNGKYLSGDGGNEGIYVDTSGNVGIGTTSPGSKLSIAGGSLSSTAAYNLDIAAGLTNGRLIAGLTGSSKLASLHTYYDDSALEMSAGSSANYVSGITMAARSTTGASEGVSLWTRSTQRLTVDSSGNVGIGTTAPGVKLEVLGQASIGAVQPTAYLGTGLTLTGSTNILAMQAASTPTSNQWALRMRDLVEGDFSIYDITNSAARLYINPSGNVGIGTTSPATLLHVSSASQGTARIETTAAGTAGPYLSLKHSGTSGRQWDLYSNGSANAVTAGYFSLYDATAGQTRLVVDTSGNVGIGTTSPWGTLSVTNTGTGPSFVVEDDTSPDSTPFIIDASGNVGVGTAGPSIKVDVAGSIGTNGGYGIMRQDASAFQTYQGGLFTWVSSNDAYTGTVDTGLSRLAAAKVAIGNGTAGDYSGTLIAGNVGIGTVSPYTKLSNYNSYINDATNIGGRGDAFTWAVSGSALGWASAIENQDATATNRNGLLVKTAATDAESYILKLESGGTNKVAVTSTGNVGIGTSAPAVNLHILGPTGVGSTGILRLERDGGYGFSNFAQFYTDISNYGLDINSGQLVVNKGSGNVGIGTTAPTYRLDVNSGSAALGLRLSGSHADGAVIRYENTSASGGRTYHVGSTDSASGAGNGFSVYDVTGSAARFLINPSGNVGIGTVSPYTKLSNYNSYINDATNIGGRGDAFTWAVSGSALGWASAIENQDATATNRNGLLVKTAATDAESYILKLESGGTNKVAVTSTGNVGIGTTTPADKLDVFGSSAGGETAVFFRNQPGINTSGTITTIAMPVFNGTTGLRISSMASSAGGFNVGNYDGFIYTGQGNSYLHFAAGDGASPQVSINPSGNVGIGTTGPGGRLEVKQSSLLEKPFVINSYGDSASYTQYKVGDSGGWEVGMSSSTDSYKYLFSYGTFGPANAKVAITNTGNVGIGTSSPAEKMEISGGKLKITSSGYGWIYANDTNHSIIIRGDRDGTAADYTNHYQYGGTLASGKGHKFWTGGVLASQTLKIQIADDGTYIAGNVGIGTTTPSTKLVIGAVDGADEGGQIALAGAPNSTVDWNVDSFQSGMRFFMTNKGSGGNFNQVMQLSSAGNVGIGTSNPDYTLDVSGTTSAKASRITSAGGSWFWIDNPTVSTMRFSSGATPGADGVGMILTNAGNVGIGTTTPQKALDVIGQLRVAASAGSGYSLIETGQSATASNNWHFGSEGNGYFNFYNGNLGLGSNRMTISSAGNVGIGTTTPGTALSVVGAITNTLGELSSADGTWGYRLSNLGAGTGGIAFGTYGGSEWARITQEGNLGIGTTNPNEGKVEVKGGSVCVDTDSNDTATSCIANESDERLKENITSISASSSLDIINALNPVSFDWRATDPEVLSHYPLLGRYAGNEHSIGLIAQQVMPVLPEALSLETVGDSEVQYYQLDYTKFIPHLIGAVKELWAKVQDLGQKVASLLQSDSEQDTEIETLKSRVNALESQLGAAAAPSDGSVNTPTPEPEPEPIPEPEAEEETVPDAEISAEEIVSEASENTEAEEGGGASASPPEAPTEVITDETETP